MPGRSPKSSQPVDHEALKKQQLLDEIHQYTYGYLFESGAVAIDEQGQVHICLSPTEATLLYGVLAHIVNHESIRKPIHDGLLHIMTLLQAAKADRSPEVFASSPFSNPHALDDEPDDDEPSFA